MATGITLLQVPQAYMPAYNNQFFFAASSNTTQPNFQYTIIVTDLLTGINVTYPTLARPDGKCVFDAGVFSENQIRNSNYIPINLFGWQAATGVRGIRVNVGETYGTVPAYTAGPNTTYIIWNGSIRFLEQPTYTFTNYVYNSITPNYKYFAGVLSDVTYTDRSNYLYALTSQIGDLSSIRILTYDANNSLLGNSIISNPFSSTSLYQDKYICIDVGYKGLLGIGSGLVSGAYPIITASVARYEIYDMTPATPLLIKTIVVGCQNYYKVMTVHYLTRNGSFQSLNFNMIHDSQTDKTVSSYVQNPNSVNNAGSGYGYDYFVATQKQLSVSTQTTLTLRTDWLTEERVMQYQECFDSPICFLDQGSSQSYISVIPMLNTYKNLPHYSNKLVKLEIQFQFNHQNFRQRA